jgi:hypothetical protein
MPQPLRSTLAVLVGFVAMMFIVIVCTVACVKAFHLQSGHPTPLYLAINVAYSLAAAFLGGWICARMAGRSPVIHGAVLAAIMLVLGAFSYQGYKGSQPVWYQLFVILVPPLVAVAGAAMLRKHHTIT